MADYRDEDRLPHENELLELLRTMGHAMREREQIMFGRLELLEKREQANNMNILSGLSPTFKAVVTVGLSTVLVFIGIGMFTGAIPSPITETRDLAKMHVEDAAITKQQLGAQTKLLRIICQNTALDRQAMTGCLE